MSQQQNDGGQENLLRTGPQGRQSSSESAINRSSNDGHMNQYVQLLQSNPSTSSQYQSTAQQIIYPRVGGVANMLGPLTFPSPNSSSTGNGQPSQSNSNFTIPAIASVMGATTVSSDVDSISMQHNDAKKSTTFNMSTSGIGRAGVAPSEDQMSTTLGGVPIPPMPANTSTAMQVQMAAVSAAKAAAPHKGYHGPKSTVKMEDDKMGTGTTSDAAVGKGVKARKSSTADLTPEEKKKLNRDRNRQHARSTRLRKKAYTNKLKELVNALHVERSDVIKKRRVAVQHLAEVQNVRRSVITQFLKFHSGCETDTKKWNTILEENFFLKQPVSPYRSFPRSEIEQVQERVSSLTTIQLMKGKILTRHIIIMNQQVCRKTKGIEAIVCDATSIAIMIESVGCRSDRWVQMKRDSFLTKEEMRTGSRRQRIVGQSSNLQHAVSSLSASSSGSSSGNRSGDGLSERRRRQLIEQDNSTAETVNQASKHATNKNNANSTNSGDNESHVTEQESSNDFHDYHAQPLPDPMLDSGNSTGSDSPVENGPELSSGKHTISADSSSGDEESPSQKSKKRRLSLPPTLQIPSKTNDASKSDKGKEMSGVSGKIIPLSEPSNEKNDQVVKPETKRSLPPNIARSGGISHNVRPVVNPVVKNDINSRLSAAPAIALPPFLGIGKRAPSGPSTILSSTKGFSSAVSNSSIITPRESVTPKNPSSEQAGPNIVSGTSAIVVADNESTSSDNSSILQILAHYHVNEDDMLLTDDVLMCPFIFRTQDAVMCGALAECVMPGMLCAQFSSRNKLLSLEMVYDAMGFMQQLERASGNEGIAQIVPNSLEMSLQPNADQARVITTANSPFLIVNVNQQWTNMTKYSQLEVEKKEVSVLHGKRTDVNAGKRSGRPVYDMADVARGRSSSYVNTFYDKTGKSFPAFVCSYPITKYVLGNVYYMLPFFFSQFTSVDVLVNKEM